MTKLLTKSLLLSALLMFLTQNAMAKSQPPAELEGMFAEFSELEEKFESAEWDAALGTIKEVSEGFEGLSSNIESNAGADVTGDFKLILKNLRKSVLKKDLDKSSKNFIVLQRLFFDVMDAYDYEVHPIMSIIDKYLDEAAEAAEKSEWDDVAREMDEVESFFKKASNMVKATGVSDNELNSFSELLENVVVASNAGDGETVETGINQLKNQFESFLAKM